MISKFSIELKHRLPKLEHVETALMGIGGKEVGTEEQRDTYYNVRSGTLKLREGGVESYLIFCERELKQGLWENKVLLHTIRPPEVADAIDSLNQLARIAGFMAMDMAEITMAEVEDERLHNTSTRAIRVAKGLQDVEYALRQSRQDTSSLHGVLQAVLGVRCIVEKKRRRWVVGNLRVTTDEVENVGAFLEIEGNLGGKKDPAEIRAAIVKVERSLGLPERGRAREGYADMVRPLVG